MRWQGPSLGKTASMFTEVRSFGDFGPHPTSTAAVRDHVSLVTGSSGIASYTDHTCCTLALGTPTQLVSPGAEMFAGKGKPSSPCWPDGTKG